MVTVAEKSEFYLRKLKLGTQTQQVIAKLCQFQFLQHLTLMLGYITWWHVAPVVVITASSEHTNVILKFFTPFPSLLLNFILRNKIT
jgi:hypothetical protein